MKRRDFCKLIATAAAVAVTPETKQISGEVGNLNQKLATDKKATLHNDQVWIRLSCGRDCLWEFGSMKGGPTYKFSAPAFAIDGRLVTAVVEPAFEPRATANLPNGATEFMFGSRLAEEKHLSLILRMQLNNDVPVIRFRYEIISDRPAELSSSTVGNGPNYLSVSLENLTEVQEIQLSNFAGLDHSNMLSLRTLTPDDFQQKTAVMGPIIAASSAQHSFILAYEHGSQVPDAFLHYELSPNREVRLTAVKGNYYSGQPISEAHPYRSVWMETAAVEGSMDQLASSFRTFVLKYMAPTNASRTPLIFYNTWNFQERNKWWYGKSYLDSMNQDRIMKEVDISHKLGVDVFVLDTGWFERTGDWQPDPTRFPNGLEPIMERLKGYGMKLGLWFNPTVAAVSSRVVREHPDWRMSCDGVIAPPGEVWGTEKSYHMCLVSDYAEFFAEKLIQVASKTGVTYFKLDGVWTYFKRDGISRYVCNDPYHHHGRPGDTPQRRGESFAFQLPEFMSQIADKISAAIPDAIVDFDVTESGRAMGLGFLASGRYFLMNNGPYYQNYDIPIKSPPDNSNLFFHTGQARAWICRTPLTYDRWIPSILFLTHYFPDDPEELQEVNIASLMLGQNGIWGDLLGISDKGVAYIGAIVAKYKLVRGDVTASDPVVTGFVSGSPEIHEKIFAETGRGVVVVFATQPGSYRYVTRHRVTGQFWASEDTAVVRCSDGKATITATFTRPGAKIAIFGVQ